MDVGSRLMEVRARLGITTRQVALFSKAIADAEGNDQFLISGPWLTQIEHEKEALPSIYKLFTLASIYGLSYPQLLGLYGVDTKKVKKYHAEMPIAKTHLAEYESTEPHAPLEVPVLFGAADRLREIRNRLGVSTREVAQLSKRIADAEQNSEFLISSPWLTQLENKTTLPSVYKLFTLAAIYGLTYIYLLSLYGVDLKKVMVYHGQMPLRNTHLAEAEAPTAINLPIRFDSGLNLNQTTLLSRMIESWGEVPLEFIQHFDLRHRLYGFVGLKDYTLYPLIRPGSFVEIDPDVKKPRHSLVRSEFDRPIYFVDLRGEYACSWCELVEDKLVLLAHSLSPVKTRILTFPKEAEIIGQVVSFTTRVAVDLGSSPIAEFRAT